MHFDTWLNRLSNINFPIKRPIRYFYTANIIGLGSNRFRPCITIINRRC
jgi:hypothetical protein